MSRSCHRVSVGRCVLCMVCGGELYCVTLCCVCWWMYVGASAVVRKGMFHKKITIFRITGPAGHSNIPIFRAPPTERQAPQILFRSPPLAMPRVVPYGRFSCAYITRSQRKIKAMLTWTPKVGGMPPAVSIILADRAQLHVALGPTRPTRAGSGCCGLVGNLLRGRKV